MCKKAFKGELVDWFYSLSILEVDTTNWESVKESFENDYKVEKLTVTSRGHIKINPEQTTSTSHNMNRTDKTDFTTVRNSKKKQICKYCKKQGHSISNCWTLKSKNRGRAEYGKQHKANEQIKPTNTISNKIQT